MRVLRRMGVDCCCYCCKVRWMMKCVHHDAASIELIVDDGRENMK